MESVAWIIITIVLSLLCLILFIGNTVRSLNIKAMKQQLLFLTKEETNTKLTLSGPDPQVSELLLLINEVLTMSKERQELYHKKERELRRQISNISHDLRTPLTSVLGYLELIQGGEVSEEEKEKYLQIIWKRSKVLLELIQGLYDLSLVEEKKYRFQETKVHLPEVLSEVLAMYYNEFEKRGFQSSVTIPEKIERMTGDRQALVRIYSNILQNVLNHGDEVLYVIVKEAEGEIVTSFYNKTRDVHKEDVPYLFERFYSAERIKSGENTGLGLAIVKAFVESMGGRVEASLEEEMFLLRVIWKVCKSET